MFSDEITSSDAFLDMPSTSQLLYYHLGMNADDDGFIASPKMVMRMIGSSQNDYEILMAKKFIIHFQDRGICVVKHWRINNKIRKDRYSETKYLPEKLSLFIKENGAYTQTENKGLPVPKGHFTVSEIEDGNQVATTRQPSIGKVRIGKDRKDTVVDESFEEFWRLYPKRRKSGKTIPKEKWDKLTDSQRKLVMEDIRKRPLEHWDWIKQNNDFVPAPEVYLNAKKEYWLQPIVKQQENKQLAPVQKVDRFVKK